MALRDRTGQRIGVFLLAASAALLSCLAASVRGADLANGQQIYATICAACHGPDPRQNQNNIRLAANNPNLIQAAINGQVPAMAFLRGMLSTAQINDVAAYIDSVVNPGGGTPALTLSAASLSFGNVPVGTTSAGQSLSLSNTGTGTLVFSGITLTPADYLMFSGCPGNLPPGGACMISLQFAPRSNGSISGTLSVASNASASPALVSLSGTGGSVSTPKVVEYYNADLDNYFITADPNEQHFVDSGAVGRWLRTGNTFAAGGPAQVCRFFGNTAINPASGVIWGPNSHFYTADAAECSFLKSIFDANAKSWKFESNDFNTTPASNGACTAGLTPVYRAYNNGNLRGVDSNHRITANFAAYQQTLAAGWKGEGVVMCAP